ARGRLRPSCRRRRPRREPRHVLPVRAARRLRVASNAEAEAPVTFAMPTPPPPPAPHPDAALDVVELAKDYGDGMGVLGVDLVVGPGELVMLVGPNGAGKSTLLGLCAGMLEPTAGHAYVLGHPVGSTEARNATSYLP